MQAFELNGRPQSQDSSQKVIEYLKNHEEFLERYVLENIPLELLERWIIRKIRRQQQYAAEIAESNEMVPNLSRWKFCVHADKREMLQELTSSLFSYPNKGHVLSELANTVAAAVNATDWRLHVYDADTKKLCSFGSNDNHLKEFQVEDTIADYVMRTKETVRWKSTEKDNRFPEGLSIDLEKPVYVLCHPVLQPDEKLSGILELYKDLTDVEFHEEDEEIVNSYLVWGGIALHYAELYVTMMKQRELNLFLLTVVKSIFQDMISMDTVILKIMLTVGLLEKIDPRALIHQQCNGLCAKCPLRTRDDRDVYPIASQTITPEVGQFTIDFNIEGNPVCDVSSMVTEAFVTDSPCCCKRHRTVCADTCCLADDLIS
ncbi:cAMP and cAMP-inhibited cGMP 3',5'-cyclic phosphodiesterase 10A [Trichonephila clavipes]|nr:cAMP and cAMP-inhibited cGMP 3',5'-cyclic phosphodiesterase 10A [Trichonephila clavipes]